MVLRRPRPLRLLALAAAATLWTAGCSSGGRRDQYYGTDVGATYRAPEAGALPPPEAGADRAGPRPDGGADDRRDAEPPDGGTDGARG